MQLKLVTRNEKQLKQDVFKQNKRKFENYNKIIQCLQKFNDYSKWFVAIHWVNCDSHGNENGPFVTQGKADSGFF